LEQYRPAEHISTVSTYYRQEIEQLTAYRRSDIDERVRYEETTRNENLVLREQIDRESMFEDIVGSSEALRRVLRQVARVAPSDSTVLILGETGTGKELIARAIHKRSQRANGMFIGVNCAAIPPSLMGSELFGHEKGAFTGATQRRLGRFELADGGTLFLDEVGDLPSETQIALLRVLQERQFERIGGTQPIAVNVRIIAATNRDLRTAVRAGTFRSDLFYRLNVFPIAVPPLRERKDDIPLLVEYLTERYASKAGKKINSGHAYNDAITEFREILKMDPGWNMARPCLYIALYNTGRKNEAARVLADYRYWNQTHGVSDDSDEIEAHEPTIDGKRTGPGQ
jgi:transcriptional regulator with GAF, ATPase, and Fis domain